MRTKLLFALALGSTPIVHAQSNRLTWVHNCHLQGNCVSNTSLPTFPQGSNYAVTLTADLDQDGDVDVLPLGPSLAMLENQMVLGGAGPAYSSFTDATSLIGLSLFNVTDGALADYDGDGDLDLAVCTQPLGGGAVWLLENTLISTTGNPFGLQDAAQSGWSAAGAFGQFSSIAAADFDGDGDSDLLVGDLLAGLTLLTNTGIGGGPPIFVPSAAGLGSTPINDIAVADLNGDGAVDVAVAAGTWNAPQFHVGLNNGAGGFSFGPLPAPANGQARTVEAADLDGNGVVDLAFGTSATRTGAGTPWMGGSVTLFANNGAGILTPTQVMGGVSSYTDIAIGDLDEDGMVELVASSREEAASFFVNGAWVTFTLPGRTRVFERPAPMLPFIEVTATFIDDDSFDPITSLPSDGGSIALADVDLDLDLDVLVGHRLAAAIGLFTNLRWQLEVPRVVNVVQLPSGNFEWTVPYDFYIDFGVPAGNLASVNVSLTPPVHVFPATTFGVLTNAPWVSGPLVGMADQGNFDMVLGPFSAATMATFVGTQLYGQAALLHGPTNALRASSVVMTTIL